MAAEGQALVVGPGVGPPPSRGGVLRWWCVQGGAGGQQSLIDGFERANRGEKVSLHWEGPEYETCDLHWTRPSLTLTGRSLTLWTNPRFFVNLRLDNAGLISVRNGAHLTVTGFMSRCGEALREYEPYRVWCASLIMRRSHIGNCRVRNGPGALYNGHGEVSLEDVSVLWNSTKSSNAGGISNYGTLNLDAATLSGNSGTYQGGAVLLAAAGAVTALALGAHTPALAASLCDLSLRQQGILWLVNDLRPGECRALGGPRTVESAAADPLSSHWSLYTFADCSRGLVAYGSGFRRFEEPPVVRAVRMETCP